MQFKRAQEVMNLPQSIDITYMNKPVWIDNVSKAQSEAQITFLDNNYCTNVPIDELIEK